MFNLDFSAKLKPNVWYNRLEIWKVNRSSGRIVDAFNNVILFDLLIKRIIGDSFVDTMMMMMLNPLKRYSFVLQYGIVMCQLLLTHWNYDKHHW